MNLQCFGGFRHTSALIGHGYTRVLLPFPTILNSPPTCIPTLRLWVVPEHWLWVPYYTHKLRLVICFTYGNIRFNAVLSNHITLAFSH